MVAEKALFGPRAFCLVVLMLRGTVATARFQDSDAERIDREDAMGTRTTLDEISYRFPLVYDDLWDAGDRGFRAYAGSFDARRFDYQEDIKLQTSPIEPTGCGFSETRHEDLVDQRTERYFQLWAQPRHQALRVRLLADGGTYKEYGDLGAAIAVWNSRSEWVEFRYWSVDHYYNSKKSAPEDLRPRSSMTSELLVNWTGHSWQGRLVASDDSPLLWIRNSRGYTYEYARRLVEYSFKIELSSTISLALQARQEWKRESKVWNAAAASFAQSLNRSVATHEIAVQRRSSRTYDEFGLNISNRKANYTYSTSQGSAAEQTPEPVGPRAVRHHEIGLRATRFTPLPFDQQSLQIGAFAEMVDQREDQQIWRRPESKAQLAWDYALSDKSHVLLTTTWDIACLIRNVPYDGRDRHCWPWAGGALDLIAVF